METSNLKIYADYQKLTVRSGVMRYASDTVNYVHAEFEFGKGWEDFDAVQAIWKSRYDTISVVLDEEGCCMVPQEVLARRSRVQVNLVGFTASEEGQLTARLTSYPALVLDVDAKAELSGAETAEITPSQFEQYVGMVSASARSASESASAASASAEQATESATSAAESEASAANSMVAASSSELAAAESALSASGSADLANASAVAADESAESASASAQSASSDADRAEAAATNATEQNTAAQTAATRAVAAMNSTYSMATTAAAARDEAKSAATEAASSKRGASIAAAAALDSKDVADSAATTAVAAKNEAVAARDRMLSKITVSQTEPQNPQEGDVWITYRVKYAVSYAYTGEVPEDAPAVPRTNTYYPGYFIDVEPTPTLEGYVFSGWFVGGSIKAGFTMPENDIEITGLWTAEE